MKNDCAPRQTMGMQKNSAATRKQLAAAIAALTLLPALPASANTLVEALTKSKLSGNFRVRHESVDIDSATTRDASALTLRSRLGIETAPISGFTAIVEFEDTRTLFGEDEYAPEQGAPYTRAAIVDPSVTEVNRAYLRYRGVRKLDLGLGRQRVIYDNARFVGNVGWRQDEQTFDALTASYVGVPNWTFNYAYVDKVNGIADIKPIYNFDLDSDDHLINVAYTGFALGKLTAYAYLLDNEESDRVLLNTGNNNELNPGLRFRSNDTHGLRFDGVYILPTTTPLRVFYTAEYAKQALTTPQGIEHDTDYYLAETGVGYASKIGMLVAKVAQEKLGSDDGLQGFQTPYATKHAFNGWADVFLNTPTVGLVDTYLTLSGDFAAWGVKGLVMYHDYARDEGSGDFGTEWNVQLIKQVGANYFFGAKFASYRADSASPFIIGTTPNIDTDKFWVWAELNF